MTHDRILTIAAHRDTNDVKPTSSVDRLSTLTRQVIEQATTQLTLRRLQSMLKADCAE